MTSNHAWPCPLLQLAHVLDLPSLSQSTSFLMSGTHEPHLLFLPASHPPPTPRTHTVCTPRAHTCTHSYPPLLSLYVPTSVRISIILSVALHTQSFRSQDATRHHFFQKAFPKLHIPLLQLGSGAQLAASREPVCLCQGLMTLCWSGCLFFSPSVWGGC